MFCGKKKCVVTPGSWLWVLYYSIWCICFVRSFLYVRCECGVRCSIGVPPSLFLWTFAPLGYSQGLFVWAATATAGTQHLCTWLPLWLTFIFPPLALLLSLPLLCIPPCALEEGWNMKQPSLFWWQSLAKRAQRVQGKKKQTTISLEQIHSWFESCQSHRSGENAAIQCRGN